MAVNGLIGFSCDRVAEIRTLRNLGTDPVDQWRSCTPGARGQALREALEAGVDARASDARLCSVDVVLRKLGKGARAVAGRLVRAPRKGSVVVIEFPDGMHEYVTTPVKRVLRIAGREVFYIETINSRYRLEVRGRETAAAEGTG
jgi:hypothetical protein